MTSLSHSPVTFTWNLASSTSASAFLRSSHSGAISVPLKSLGLAGFVTSRRDFTVSVKVSRGEMRHVYPLIAARKKIMEIKKLVNETDLDFSGAMISLENKLQKKEIEELERAMEAEKDKIEEIQRWTEILEARKKRAEEAAKDIEAVKKEMERAKVKEEGIKQFDWSFPERYRFISQFKKDIKGSSLSPSQIKAIEAEAKEVEERWTEILEARKKRAEEAAKEIEAVRKEMERAKVKDAVKKGIKQFDWSFPERYRFISQFKKDIEGSPLSPSLIKAIEAEKKELEERRTEILEARKKKVEEVEEFEAFMKERERRAEEKATRMEFKQFELSFLELSQSISQFVSQCKKHMDKTKKKIEELDGAPLSPSLIKAIEAEKKEIEELERRTLIRETLHKELEEAWKKMAINKGIGEREGTTEEGMKKESKQFELFSEYLSDSKKDIEAMEKKIVELDGRIKILEFPIF